MSIFSIFSGSLRAKKVSTCVSGMTTGIVNFLIQSGLELRLPDTALIFQDVYACCLFMSFRPSESEEARGATILASQSLLKDYLLDLLGTGHSDAELRPGIEEILNGLQDHSSGWTRELMSEHQELNGHSVRDWIPAVTAKLNAHIEYILSEESQRVPIGLLDEICIQAESCVKVLKP